MAEVIEVNNTAESETNDAGVHLNRSEMETETSESPRHRNSKRPQSPSKNDGYVFFIPPTFFKKISSNEKSTVYQCLLGCPKARSHTTVSHSSLNNARRHITGFLDISQIQIERIQC